MELWESIVHYGSAVVAGVAMGMIYFGGLWWTVQRMPMARHPWALYAASLAIRGALTLAVIYVVLTQLGVLPVLAMLAGFLVIRMRWIGQFQRELVTDESVRGPAQ